MVWIYSLVAVIAILLILIYRKMTFRGKMWVVISPEGKVQEMILNDEKVKACRVLVAQRKFAWAELERHGWRCKKVSLRG